MEKPGKPQDAPGSAKTGKKDHRSVAQSSAPQRSNRDFPIVGIGASAGGLHALKRLFGAMPEHDKGRLELTQILGLLRSCSSHDFRCYKEGTLLRRTRRRMSLHKPFARYVPGASI